jgi:hypothetical protein
VSSKRPPHADLFGAFVLLFAASAAALISHVGIDIAGDYLLAHDTYDGVDHQSRSELFAFGLTIAIGAVSRLLWDALREARRGRTAVRAEFDDAFGRGPWRFVLLVLALTLPALATMEAFDLSRSGVSFADPAALFGGSLTLGLAVTVPAAVGSAFVVRLLARLLTASQRSLSVALRRLIALVTRAGRPAARRVHIRGAGLTRRYRSILARRSGKRGPPLGAS